jgi:hypothetical protein
MVTGLRLLMAANYNEVRAPPSILVTSDRVVTAFQAAVKSLVHHVGDTRSGACDPPNGPVVAN